MRIKYNMLETDSIWQGIFKKGTQTKLEKFKNNSRIADFNQTWNSKASQRTKGLNVFWGMGASNLKMTG